jgi:hypothetical protein
MKKAKITAAAADHWKIYPNGSSKRCQKLNVPVCLKFLSASAKIILTKLSSVILKKWQEKKRAVAYSAVVKSVIVVTSEKKPKLII